MTVRKKIKIQCFRKERRGEGRRGEEKKEWSVCVD